MTKQPVFNVGQILLWWGSIASIPSGYHLCDGKMGTPDLDYRFIVGAGNAYDPDDTGGQTTHRHWLYSDLHDHTMPSDTYVKAGAAFSVATDSDRTTIWTGYQDNRPPYHALCYIMKIN